MLAQALPLDGGRYATPYGFVRALKQRVVKAALPVRADAVRLLTIHGAKGLEADTVFVMDADPERQGVQTTTLLVEWPVDAERPTRCAFVYNEARCPVSLQAALAAELGAREREELNGLYVAMSRAKRQLVFSATEPFQAPLGASWWSRVASFSPVRAPVPAQAELWLDAPAPPVAVPVASVVLKVLPSRSGAALDEARGEAARVPPARSIAAAGETAAATRAARLGRAVHRALEWAVASQGTSTADAAAAAAREFAVPAAAVRERVEAIVDHPDGARFYRGAQIRWSGNEVSVSDGGDVLRIDRLVHIDEPDGATWWVLDYKLSHAPDELDAYRTQLLRYRAAIERAQPGEAVRCAFVTGDGRVVEVA